MIASKQGQLHNPNRPSGSDVSAEGAATATQQARGGDEGMGAKAPETTVTPISALPACGDNAGMGRANPPEAAAPIDAPRQDVGAGTATQAAVVVLKQGQPHNADHPSGSDVSAEGAATATQQARGGDEGMGAKAPETTVTPISALPACGDNAGMGRANPPEAAAPIDAPRQDVGAGTATQAAVVVLKQGQPHNADRPSGSDPHPAQQLQPKTTQNHSERSETSRDHSNIT